MGLAFHNLRRQEQARLAALQPSAEPEAAHTLTVVPEPAPEPVDPRIEAAQHALTVAQHDLDTAEAAYIEKSTKESWVAVQSATVAREKATIVLRQTEALVRREASARLEQARAAMRERFDKLCLLAGEDHFRAEIAPLMARAAAIDLEQFAIRDRMEQLVLKQQAAALEAARLAKELGDTTKPPKSKDLDSARQHVGWALFDARSRAGLERHLWQGVWTHWYAQSTEGIRTTESMRAFLDSVLERVKP
jgi:hypothetical protein